MKVLSKCQFFLSSQVLGSVPPALTVYFCNFCGQQGNTVAITVTTLVWWGMLLQPCTMECQQYSSVHRPAHKHLMKSSLSGKFCNIYIMFVNEQKNHFCLSKTGPTSEWHCLDIIWHTNHHTCQTLYFIKQLIKWIYYEHNADYWD